MRGKVSCAAAIVALWALPAFAQPSDRTVVSFTGGVSTGEHQTGGAFGGTVLVNLNNWIAVEGNGTYLDRGSGADAVNVGGSLIINFVSARAAGVPYFVVGGSVHHATFDLSDERYYRMGEMPNMAGYYSCTAMGQRYLCGQMPMFYSQRLQADDLPPNGRWDDAGFTDPAVSFGGGLRLNITDRFQIRPDLRAVMIFTGDDSHTIGLFVVNFGYRF
jgi:hypothetical protein